jgi:hypothetical protein
VGLLASHEPGVLLAALFDPQSKTLKKDMDVFHRKLDELQAKLHVEQFVVAHKHEGKKLRVKVLAARGGADKRAAAWQR